MKNYLRDYKSDDRKKKKKKSVGGSVYDFWQQGLDPMQRWLDKMNFKNSIKPAGSESGSDNLTENAVTLAGQGQSAFNLSPSNISYPGSESYQPIYTFENKDPDSIVKEVAVNSVDMEAVLRQQEMRDAQLLRERWRKMSLYDIVKELGYNLDEVQRQFGVEEDRMSDGKYHTSSVVYNLYIKEKIIDGWRLGDPRPETEVEASPVPRIKAITFTEAFKKAGQTNLGPDKKFIWYRPWVAELKDDANPVEMTFEYRIASPSDRIEYSNALKIADQYDLPIPSEIYVFLVRYKTATGFRIAMQDRINAVEKVNKHLEQSSSSVLSSNELNVQLQLSGTEDIYKKYKNYNEYHDYAYTAPPGTYVAPVAYGGKVTDELKRKEQSLKYALTKGGFASKEQYASLIEDFTTTFSKKANAIAISLLEYNKQVVSKEKTRYNNVSDVRQLYNDLSTARQLYKEAENYDFQIHRDEFGILLPSEVKMNQKNAEKKRALIGRANTSFKALAKKYPILADEKLDKAVLLKADIADLQEILKEDAGEREEDIETTIENIRKNPELIWKLDPVLQLTMKVLGIPKDSVMHQIILDTQAKKHADEAAIKLAVTVFAIVAGLFSFGEGTVAVLAAATAAGVGGYQTYTEIQEYRTMSAASGTAFDRALTLTGDDPSLFWLAFSIAGTILDVSAAANLFAKLAMAGKAFNAVGKTEVLAVEVEKVIQELKITNAELKTNILKAAENEKKLQEAIAELGKTGQLYSVVDPFSLLLSKSPALVKISYYLAQKGIVRFEQFLLELKSHRIMESLKGVDLGDPKIQEELKKIFEEGLERFKKNPNELELTRFELIQKIGETIDLSSIKKLDPDALIGFRGSLAKGTKGPHKGNAPFDPSDFDIDAFIVSDKLANEFSKDEIFRDAKDIGLGQFQKELAIKLKSLSEFSGLRDNKITFRIFTQAEINKKLINKDIQIYFINE